MLGLLVWERWERWDEHGRENRWGAMEALSTAQITPTILRSCLWMVRRPLVELGLRQEGIVFVKGNNEISSIFQLMDGY